MDLLKFLVEDLDLSVLFLEFLSVVVLADRVIDESSLLLLIILYDDLGLS